MAKVKKEIDSKKLAALVVQGIQEKKGEEISVLDLRKTGNSIADFFIICVGNSDTQIDAIADSVEEEVYKASGQVPFHKEGAEAKSWVLLDYFDVVVHIFTRDRRSFYALEELWSDGKIKHVAEGEAFKITK